MGIWTNLGMGILGGIGGEVANEVGYGIGEMTGYNERRRQDQLKQQQQLTDMQREANMALMNASYSKQMEMWKNTNATAQVAEYKKAGLNPALMYAKGGPGGQTGSGTASVGGGQASDETSRQLAQTQSTAMGLQMMKLQSEIDVNESVANLNKAKVPQTEAETTNITESTKLVAQQTKNAEIANQGISLDNDLKSLQKTLNTETLSASIEQIKEVLTKTKSEVNNIIANTKKSNVEGNILIQAENDIVRTYNQTLKNLITENVLKNKEIEVKQQEIYTAVNDRVLSRIDTLANKDYKTAEIEIQRSMQELQKTLVQMQVDQQQQNAIMSAVGTIVGALVLKGAFAGGRTAVQGFK